MTFRTFGTRGLGLWRLCAGLLGAACGGSPPDGGATHPLRYPEAKPIPIIVSDIKSPKAEVMLAKPADAKPAPGTFASDVAWIEAHTRVVVLGEGTDARVAVAPGYQGRVMTSTARGDAGSSFGWINREAIASGERKPHMNVLGGEDRFWFGPEGGQYGLYFAPGVPYDLDHWQVPEAIDWGAWAVSERTPTTVSFRKEVHLQNHSGTEFDVRVGRKIVLLDGSVVAERIGMSRGGVGAGLPGGVTAVAYESQNTITNVGKKAWSKNKGLLSVWILGMYRPSPTTTVVLPFQPGSEAKLGPVVNDAYFGKIPPSRLKVEDGLLFFRGDGKERGKIGVPRKRARPLAASYDAEHGVLTLVEYTLPEGSKDYVNSMWEEQKDPYGGDVVNSYNDGPLAPGKPPLGPFYEIETSSPAAALAPGASITHVHRTIHIEGRREALDPIAKKILGVGVSEIDAALPGAR